MIRCLRLKRNGIWIYTTRRGVTYSFEKNWLCYDITDDELKELLATGMVELKKEEKSKKVRKKEKKEEVKNGK